MQFFIDNKALILGFLFAFSELLALIPGIKANSIFQFVFNALKTAVAPADAAQK